MNLIINCSNLKNGGGLQVADSVCKYLNEFEMHNFIVVLSSKLQDTYHHIIKYKNIKVYNYDYVLTIKKLLSGRDIFLDELVKKNNIEGVITIFGPSYWTPKCPHLSGFARPHLVIPNSPFFKSLNSKQLLLIKIKYWFLKISLNKNANFYYTENKYISEKLKKILNKNKEIYTITNYYNQIFDTPDKWEEFLLPKFEGTTLLTVSVAYPHKNLPITIEIAKILKIKYPNLNFRFVITITKENFPQIPVEVEKYFLLIGPVKISQCPSLYKQADIMFQPSLLECFSATYPEAMKMHVPIITTDLEFAHGLCNDAALYFSPITPQSAAEAIYKLATNKQLSQELTQNGEKQLKKYNTHKERAYKLIQTIENIINNKK